MIKKIAFIFSLTCFSCTISQAYAQDCPDKPEWHFTDNEECWIFTNNLSGAVSDGILTLTIEWHDPFMHSQPSLNINAEDNWEILVKMKNNTPDTTGQLYFITTTYSGWSEDMLQTFSVIPLDSVYREYRIPMNTLPSWKGIIEQIRLDPLARANSGTVDIDYIMVTGPYMMILLYFRHHPLLDCPLNLLCQQVQP